MTITLCEINIVLKKETRLQKRLAFLFYEGMLSLRSVLIYNGNKIQSIR